VRNSGDGYTGEVVVRELATGVERQLTADGKTVDEVVWASNDVILFVSNKSGCANLWAVPAGGGDAAQITHGTVAVMSARISADTKKLVYFQNEITSHIWISGLDGGHARQVTFDDVNFQWAVFSPDTRQIAAVIGALDQFSPERQLVVMDRQGKNRRALTSASQIADMCRWAPDGKWLAYTSRPAGDPDDSNKVYIIDPANPGTPRLVGRGSTLHWIDGESLVLVDWPRSLLYSLTGGSPTQVYRDSTLAFPLRWTNEIFFYDGRKGRDGCWIVPLDSAGNEKGEPRRIEPADDPYFTAPPDFRFRVYQKAGGMELWRVWLSDGRKERLGTALPGRTFISDVSMEGDSLLWLGFTWRSKLGLIANVFE
jgi:dipeptidyl aminopeptidase/acylaminoacyl peptidase